MTREITDDKKLLQVFPRWYLMDYFPPNASLQQGRQFSYTKSIKTARDFGQTALVCRRQQGDDGLLVPRRRRVFRHTLLPSLDPQPCFYLHVRK